MEQLYSFLNSCEDSIERGEEDTLCPCSIYLKDELYIPCAVIQKSDKYTDLACRRFEEEKRGKGIFRKQKKSYRKIVKHFITSGNIINSFEIKSIEKSPFYMPSSIQKRIHGETLMGWTGFVLEMKDSKLFSFGTDYDMLFFELPKGYTFDDVINVHNHSYVDQEQNLISLRQGKGVPKEYSSIKIYKSRPFFTCYLN